MWNEVLEFKLMEIKYKEYVMKSGQSNYIQQYADDIPQSRI